MRLCGVGQAAMGFLVRLKTLNEVVNLPLKWMVAYFARIRLGLGQFHPVCLLRIRVGPDAMIQHGTPIPKAPGSLAA